ncbi:MAG: Alcohol dehydrogenase, zinc-binding protein [Ignavibacteria bacterium]|nr:Alcohol dehydrogenase, zinc-binding protein [Ignavibacteria bacterium]
MPDLIELWLKNHNLVFYFIIKNNKIMLQVIQHQRSGEISVEELPAPNCHSNGILVRTAYSLISAGTEKTSVENSQSSLLERARKQPEQVRTVLNNLKKEGLASTINKVQTKLESYKQLGYSASGTVIESTCDEFAPGDRVACAGAGLATHSGIISIPKNLAIKIPEIVTLEDAAFTTLGIIALQGVRQADVRLGETVAVIGLGLIGQITVQLLKASGCRVVGLDINTALFEQAIVSGCEQCYPSNSDSINNILSFTRGIGCDSVILTAGTESNQPLELALKIARKKGKVIVVGAVGMNVPRSPFYEKELELKISCSYGPGRYDLQYEELGFDYPVGYVRWSENRNMQAFVDLLAGKKIDVKALTTHIFDVEKATDAYDLITGKVKEHYLGILLKYGENAVSQVKSVINTKAAKVHNDIKIGFVGAGNFAQFYLLPTLKESGCELTSVSTATPANAKSVASKFGFSTFSTDSDEIIEKSAANLIFCASKHDSHSHYVIKSIEAGKPVFVEKPFAINREQLEAIDAAVNAHNGQVMVGFNRRFSDSFRAIKKFFNGYSEPMAMSYRVNAGFIPKNHWLNFPGQGGRIIGEVCHFVDCMIYLTGELPIKVYAEQLSGENREAVNRDNVIIMIKFSNGSAGNIEYLANGDSSLPKEYFSVFCGRKTAIMDNFTTVELFSAGKMKKLKFDGKKGHREEVKAMLDAIKSGGLMPIPYNEIKAATLTTFAVIESLQSGNPVYLKKNVILNEVKNPESALGMDSSLRSE